MQFPRRKEAVYNLCLEIAGRYLCRIENNFSDDQKQIVLNASLQAHKEIIQEILDKWQQNNPCCTDCLVGEIFRLSPQGVCEEKRRFVAEMYNDANDFLRYVKEKGSLQTDAVHLTQFQQEFERYFESQYS